MRTPIPALCCLLAVPLAAQAFEGRVVGIADGDTLTVLDEAHTQHRIRLAGADAPEKGQAFGQVSRSSLGELVHGRTVQVVPLKRDQYGRTVAQVLVEGSDVGLRQVEAGLAWAYRAYLHELPPLVAANYLRAEVAARLRHAGLWADPAPIPPWEFRAAGR